MDITTVMTCLLCALSPGQDASCPEPGVCMAILEKAPSYVSVDASDTKQRELVERLGIIATGGLNSTALLPTRRSTACPTPVPKPVITIIPQKATIHYNLRYSQGDSLPTGVTFPYGAAGITQLGIIPYRMAITVGETASCYYTKEIKFHIGYKDIPVYIDKEYKQGTCHFDKIKEHEKQHAMWAINAATFFAPDIKRVLKKAVNAHNTGTPKNNATPQSWVAAQKGVFLPELYPVLSHIQRKINEKNNAMDTPEGYRRHTEELIKDCYSKPFHFAQ